MEKIKIIDSSKSFLFFKKIRLFKIYYLVVGVFIILSNLFVACDHKGEKGIIPITKDKKVDTILALEKVASLKNNLEHIGYIRSISFVNTEKFVVSITEPAKVILYDIKGNQIKKIGDRGRGPFEYNSPALVRTNNEKIYVWCNMHTKLFLFDKAGEPISEHNFDKAISDFEVNDDYIFFYRSAFKDQPIIEIYDLNSEKFITQEYGEKTNEQLLIELNSSAGALALSKNHLFFSLNHKPLIYKINLSNWSKKTYQIKDPLFNVIDIDMTPEEILQDMMGNAHLIVGSDIITGIYLIENNFLVVGEVGEIKMNGFDYEDISNRKQRYYIFDQNMNLEYAISAKINKYCSTALFSTDGYSLYGLKVDDNGDRIEYDLVRIAY